MILVDTDVLVWYTRGNARAAAALEGLAGMALSVVSYIELVQGVRSRRELAGLRATLAALEARVLQIDELISAKAMFYIEQHFHAHSLQLADALIAATAVAAGCPLLTANIKHYRAIGDVEVRRFRAD
ncbi:MAG: PIN domain-containing protein [Betaproteobacteria bacterium]